MARDKNSVSERIRPSRSRPRKAAPAGEHIQDSQSLPIPAEGELVSVIIPAYNAQATIHATLCSVRAQTHRNLEILVVDDGSTDATVEIVERHAKLDNRIILLRQTNAGVAAARNNALQKAKGRYFAPIDADDLWVADKIERQLAAVYAHPGTVGLVYSWFALVDNEGYIIDYVRRAHAEGDVMEAMCDRNFVGNGSSPLILRSTALEVGGYDSELRRQNAEGCEDYKLYFQIAERHPFVLIRDYLVGYRLHPGSMSRHADRMVRSRVIVTYEISLRHEHLAARLRKGNTRAKRLLLAGNIRSRQFGAARKTIANMIRTDPVYTLKELSVLAWRATRAANRDVRRIVFGRKRRLFPTGKPLESPVTMSQLP